LAFWSTFSRREDTRLGRAAAGRSLWKDAWARLRANYAAMASAAFLVLLILACVFGPAVAPHDYRQQFQDYTKVPASLTPYPEAGSEAAALAEALGDVEIVDYGFAPLAEDAVPEGTPPTESPVGRITLHLSGSGIDRSLAESVSALPRFADAALTETAADGRSGTLTADVLEPDIILDSLNRALRRARVDLVNYAVAGDRITIDVASARTVDPRIAEFVARSDLFENATSMIAPDGMSAAISADIVSELFLFGTDTNGRDLLARTLVAGRISLTIGLLASVVALVLGIGYGAVAGYFGGRTDMLMMRVVDILYSLPFIFFVILLIVFFGRSVVLMFVAVGAVEWLDMARIVRGQTLAIKRHEYVEAAQALGVGTGGILRRHVVPNLLGTVVVYVTLVVPKVILLESFLSFLSLGVNEPLTSWGVLISEGSRNLQGAPWLLVFPTLFLVATLFALNFVGDGLRDALDPKDR